MSSQSFEKFLENERNREYQVISILKLTPTYRQFRGEMLERIKGEIENVKAGYMADPFSGYTGAFPPDHPEYRFDAEWQLMDIFCHTPGGAEIKRKLEIEMGFSTYRAVRVVGWPQDGRFLTLKIDLECGKDQIREAFQHWLDLMKRWYPHPRKTRGKGAPLPQRTNEKIRAYEMVKREKGNIQQATRKLHPQTEGKGKSRNNDPDMNTLYQNVKESYEEIQGIIDRVMKSG